MRLLVLDIETTGLRYTDSDITVIALAELDSESLCISKKRCVNLLRAQDEVNTQHATDMLLNICADLDSCDRIVAFNGISFDLPFIAHKSGLVSKLEGWSQKTIDFCSFIYKQCGKRIGMAALCKTNCLKIEKSASGLDAIKWAEERNHELLESYCLQDVVVLVELTSLSLRKTIKAEVGSYHQRSSALLYFRIDGQLCAVIHHDRTEAQVPPPVRTSTEVQYSTSPSRKRRRISTTGSILDLLN